MAVTAAVVGAVAAATSAGVAIANYSASQDAARAQKDLVTQQQKQLQDQRNAASAEAAREATTGSSFGFSEQTPRTLLTGFGFGSTPGGSPNSGRGQITGLG